MPFPANSADNLVNCNNRELGAEPDRELAKLRAGGEWQKAPESYDLAPDQEIELKTPLQSRGG